MAGLFDVLQAELLGFLVIAEQLGIPAPANDGSQSIRGVVGRHMILQFVAETHRRCPVIPSFLQHLTDHVRQRDVCTQSFREQGTTAINIRLQVVESSRSQPWGFPRAVLRARHRS